MTRIIRFGAACTAALFLGLSACDDGPSGPSGPGPIASVSVAPANTSVAVGTTQQLTASAADASGTTVAATFTWSSIGRGHGYG